MSLAFQLKAPRWGGVSHRGAYASPENTASPVDPAHVGSCEIKQNDARTCGQAWHKTDTSCSGNVHGQEKENPGALAGATGTDYQDWLSWIDNNIHREVSARALMSAVLDCDPRDRIPLMERFIEALRPGQPIFAFEGVMAEASFWADMASTAERKAYALASFTRLSATDQAAFLSYVQKGAEA